MKTDYQRVITHFTNEYFVSFETATLMAIEHLTERGFSLPFSTFEEYIEWDKNANLQESQEKELAVKESAFIKSLKYQPFSIHHKRELFRKNIFSLTTEHGDSEEKAFERMQRVSPQVFDSLEDFQKYVISLRSHIPEMNPKSALRF